MDLFEHWLVAPPNYHFETPFVEKTPQWVTRDDGPFKAWLYDARAQAGWLWLVESGMLPRVVARWRVRPGRFNVGRWVWPIRRTSKWFKMNNLYNGIVNCFADSLIVLNFWGWCALFSDKHRQTFKIFQVSHNSRRKSLIPGVRWIFEMVYICFYPIAGTHIPVMWQCDYIDGDGEREIYILYIYIYIHT